MSPHTSAARALPLLLLAVTLSGLACKAPVYEELEAERPRQCNAEHPCADGYTCVGGVCVTGTPQVKECEPNAERPCGDFDKGECRKGVQRCGQDGKWDTVCAGEVRPVLETCNGKDDDCDGAPDDQIAPVTCALTAGVCAGKMLACVPSNPSQVCDASTYGSDYEVTETRCDTLDNDCDGQADEDLTRACEKTLGVCAGTRSVCQGGVFVPARCSDDDYRANSVAYEFFELTCDTLDNDCDGNADKWDARNLTVSTTDSRTPEIAAIPGGTVPSAVVLYEEEGKVLTQVINSGGLGKPQVPSATISVADKSYGGVVATDGQLVAASWIEEISGTTRVMLTLLGPDGTSVLDKGGATTIFNDVTGTIIPTRLSIAVSNGRIAVAMEDLTGVSVPVIRLTTIRASTTGTAITLTEEKAFLVSEAPNKPNRNPHVSAAKDGEFNVAWETVGNGVSVKTYRSTGSTSRNVSFVGGSSASAPHVFTTVSSGKTYLYYVETQDSRGTLKVLECMSSTCTAFDGAPFPDASGTAMAELTLVTDKFGEQPTVALWTEAGVSRTVPVRYSARLSDGKYVLGTLTPDLANGAHPVATFLDTDSPRTFVAAFTSDSTGGLVGGDIYLRPLCSF